ncbi:MAG TPA: amino acid adenylation domain-containing protein, partial [Candidatus Binatia bacterium]|nr:amino acid adenylation domain-containing protein [Candidatus Binatia bacterium]
ARATRRLPMGLVDELKQLSRRQGVTLFMTLLAALKILLGRLSGQTDIVVGSTIAGRSRRELDGVIGFFINALALRTDLSGNPTFVELLERVRAVCLDAYTHQDLPFERIVEKINPQRDLGRHPIFEVLFNLAEVGDRELKLTGCETTKIRQSIPGAKFDLVVQAPEIDGCIELTMVYNADLFAESRIVGMLEQFGFLLKQVASAPALGIDGYSLLSPQSKEALPDPTAKLDRAWYGAIQEFVSRRAEARPDVAAVVDRNQSWNYGDLDRVSSQLANHLIAMGIQSKDPVAIYAHRDATLALALLGVLKVGALFVILDPTYPPARLVEYLRIARPKALLEMEGAEQLPDELVSWLDASENRVRINLSRLNKDIAGRLVGFSDVSPEVLLNADDPAYIAFTSGSSGEPKGVLCRHGPITYFLPWQEETFGLGDSDRYALLSGLAYNHMHRDIFTALASGATLHVPTSDCLREPEQLVDWLHEQEITILHFTPALARLLCGSARRPLPAVRRIFLGGDVLTRADVSALRKLAPNAKMVSFYGATETQRAVGYFAIADEAVAAEKNARQTIPTGKGIQDVQLLILAANGQMAGIGEVGELYVRSPHLAAGYFDDDTLTAAAFLVNPFTGQADDRLYRTGEFGRYLPDGNVEWVGRQDRHANIRGFRVGLAEVETALCHHLAVRNAAVVAREFPGREAVSAARDQRLIAYIETRPETSVNLDELRELLRTRLPHYMMPAHFHLMERLPLSPNGKVDYQNLPALDLSLPSGGRLYEAPQNPLEQQLSEVLAGLLDIERVSRLDSFFELGGHSLLAAQAAARIRELFHVRLDVRSFLETPTVEALAKRIEMMRASAGETPDPSKEREEFEL